MIVRSVSRSRSPVSGSWVVIAQRGTGAEIRRHRLAESDPSADPGVLVVRGPASSSISSRKRRPSTAARAEVVAEQLERAIGDQRGRVSLAGPADPIAAHEPDRPAAVVGQRGRPWPLDDVADRRSACGPRSRSAAPSSHGVVDDRAIRERQPELGRRGVDVGTDLDEGRDDESVDEAVRGVDQVEAAVLDHAALGEVDLGRMLEAEAPDGRDREAGDGRHGAMLPDSSYIRKTPNRVSGIGAWRAASMPSASTRRVSSGSMTPSSHSRAVAKYGLPSRSYVSRIGASKASRSASSANGAADRRQDPGRLLAAHDADPGVRPRPQEARLVGAAGHRVVPGAEAAADDHRELRHLGAGDRGHHLRPVLGDAAGLVLAADHEAGDVLEEHERDLPLGGELDEVGALERRRAEQDPVVGDDPDRVALDVGEPGHERLAVARLEVVEAAAVDEAGDDLADLDGPARVGRDGAVEPGRVDGRRLRRRPVPGRRRAAAG